MQKVLDCSNYTGRLSAEQIASLQDNGVGLVIVRASLETNRDQRVIAQQQMKALSLAGMPFWCYGWCYWEDNPRTAVDDWYNLINPYLADYHQDPQAGQLFWLDCEDGNPGYAAVDWLNRAFERADQRFGPAGIRCGIYTGKWWWQPQTGDNQEFSIVPLWDANYNGMPGEGFKEYGGWHAPLLHQYEGTSTVGLVDNVDLNVMLLDETDGLEDPVLQHIDAVWGWLDEAEGAKRLVDARHAIRNARGELIEVKHAVGYA